MHNDVYPLSTADALRPVLRTRRTQAALRAKASRRCASACLARRALCVCALPFLFCVSSLCCRLDRRAQCAWTGVDLCAARAGEREIRGLQRSRRANLQVSMVYEAAVINTRHSNWHRR